MASASLSIDRALPDAVAGALQQALESLPSGDQARISGPANEGALNHVLFIETPAGRSVFRMRRAASAEEIYGYLSAMYRSTGFPELGGVFRLRTIAEEIAFMRRALARGLPLPALLRDGGDWMLIEFITGRTAYEAVKQGDLSVVPKVVETLHAAHRAGIIYGDRWGDNEVIDRTGRVRLIDFDVEWTLSSPSPGLLEALEIAVYLFNALRLTSDRSGMLDLVRDRIAPQLRGWGYDMDRVAAFAHGIGRFYLDPDKPGNAWSLPSSLYLTLAQPTERLVHHLRAA